MTLELSDELVQTTRLSELQIRQTLAVALFRENHLTLAQAARLAEMDRIAFQHVLASRGIPLHYTAADYEDDLRAVATPPPA